MLNVRRPNWRLGSEGNITNLSMFQNLNDDMEGGVDAMTDIGLNDYIIFKGTRYFRVKVSSQCRSFSPVKHAIEC